MSVFYFTSSSFQVGVIKSLNRTCSRKIGRSTSGIKRVKIAFLYLGCTPLFEGLTEFHTVDGVRV